MFKFKAQSKYLLIQLNFKRPGAVFTPYFQTLHIWNDFPCINNTNFLHPVRDAAARLPNGEGTRADICELLKDSQYLAPGVTDAQVELK